MSAATGLVVTLDLRSCCREHVLRNPPAPGTLQTMLTRQVGFDVSSAERLLIVDEAHAAAAHLAGLDALTAGRPAASVLLVLVGPAPDEIAAPGTRGAPVSAGASDDPWNGTGAWGEPLDGVPGEETLPDLDAPYDPALYAFVDDTAFVEDTAFVDDTTEESAGSTGAAASPPPSRAAAVSAILWAGAVEGRPWAAAVDSDGPEVGAAGTSAAAGPVRLAGGTGDDGPALRALFDALHSPEVFDQVTRKVSAMPGCLAFPRIRAFIGRLPDDVLRRLRIGAVHRFDAETDATAVRELVGKGQLALLDPRPQATAVIAFAPQAARPEPAPAEADRTDPADPVGPSIEITWTAATLVAGLLRLTPARDAGVLGVLFPDMRP
ncbi:hypothetical protein [Frankia sp. QA3]|uniref:hypothetical protein n=1 Tax=Frankia sp. QA3 TaxID=710111 RepID=UPI000269CB2D|nr:hypothetical protein [Frankia sp. QA3]EIV95244.1 hypothetical protein FraQA3DRAFT_5052 [Frankia sp. QA3]